MMKKTTHWLLVLAIITSSFSSCIHDETSSVSEASILSKEYTSKTLWKEDEKYIKNVKKIFETYSDPNYVKARHGEVAWNYATTAGEESFLEVPVIKDGKVNFTLVVKREEDKVFFKIDPNEKSKKFFDLLVFKNRENLSGTFKENSGTAQSKNSCVTIYKTVTWTDTVTGAVLQVDHFVEMHCSPAGPYLECMDMSPDSQCGGGSGGDGGSGGGGGGGYQYPDAHDNTPCIRTQNRLLQPTSQLKINELKQQSTLGGEKGVKFMLDGTPSPTITGGKHSVNFGDKTGYAGGYHNHTPTGIPMFSPADIDQLLGFARAQPTSTNTPGNAYLGVVAPNGMHYVMNFNGTYQDALTNFSQEELNKFTKKYIEIESNLTDFGKNGNTYINSDGTINNLGVEILFFETLKKMGLSGKIILQRIELDNTIQNIEINTNNQLITTSC
ncbi:hypothetical protein [Chryseobacterium culicis]|uniref:Uncharacterized protein n=1 Tax=Chryseobacterium culicis TaxID=680127 RepID=A0A1H6GV98_CHRCI|nr:hypothetical protein [Chryseobacterium culicis]SEH27407.1 hypothetical protein SAMN05421593_0291 [Chryseobacterium culicis]